MRRQLRVLSNRLWSDQAGFSLLELILAVAIISLTLTAMVVMSNTTLESSGGSRDQAVADRYAREGVEVVRQYRDNAGWDALRRVGGYSDDHILWGGPSTGTVFPSCVRVNADRYYFVFILPASGAIGTIDPLPSRATACGSHADFADTSTYQYKWYHNFCANSALFTMESEFDRRDRAIVAPNYYRFINLGFMDANTVFVRSTVCYYDGGQPRSVNVDSQLTNWQ